MDGGWERSRQRVSKKLRALLHWGWLARWRGKVLAELAAVLWWLLVLLSAVPSFWHHTTSLASSPQAAESFSQHTLGSWFLHHFHNWRFSFWFRFPTVLAKGSPVALLVTWSVAAWRSFPIHGVQQCLGHSGRRTFQKGLPPFVLTLGQAGSFCELRNRQSSKLHGGI